METEKFIFDRIKKSETIDPQNSIESLNGILVKENLTEICKLMNLERPNETVNKPGTTLKDLKSQKVPSRKQNLISKKEYEFVDEDVEMIVGLPENNETSHSSQKSKPNTNSVKRKANPELKKYF